MADLVEGETLAYQITVGERFRILILSTANFVERELEGPRPDLAIVAAGGGTIHDYVSRLMHTLDYPRWVLPTHWDDFDYPLDQPTVDWGGLVPLQEALAAASPKTTSSSWTIWRRSTVTMSAEACEDAEIRLGITRRMILVLV